MDIFKWELFSKRPALFKALLPSTFSPCVVEYSITPLAIRPTDVIFAEALHGLVSMCVCEGGAGGMLVRGWSRVVKGWSGVNWVDED